MTAAIGLAVPFLPLAGWVLATLATLVHELGHALVSWLAGRPAVPAFDFGHGGGITMVRDRWMPLVVLLVLAWALAAWQLRGRRPALIALGVAVALWSLTLLGGGDEALITGAGHAGVLAFAAICLARGWSGVATAHGAERALYAVVGWALTAGEARFALGLLTDATRRAHYLDGKRGIDNDFVQLAQRWGWSLEAVALLHVLAVAAVPAIAAWWFVRWRRRERAAAEQAAVARWRAAR